MTESIFWSANKLLSESVNNLNNVQFEKPSEDNLDSETFEDDICEEIKFNTELRVKRNRYLIQKNNKFMSNSVALAKEFKSFLPMVDQVKYFLNVCIRFISNMQNIFDYISDIEKRNQTIQNRIVLLSNNNGKKEELLKLYSNNEQVITDYIEDLNQYIKAHIELCNKLFDLCNMSCLTTDELAVFISRYFKLKSWIQITEETFFSERAVYLFNSKAIKKIAKYLVDKGYTTIIDYFDIELLNKIFNGK